MLRVRADLHQQQQTFEEISHEKWRFGETPEFSHHIEGRFEAPAPWGTIDVHIDSKKGEILQAKVDYFFIFFIARSAKFSKIM